MAGESVAPGVAASGIVLAYFCNTLVKGGIIGSDVAGFAP